MKTLTLVFNVDIECEELNSFNANLKKNKYAYFVYYLVRIKTSGKLHTYNTTDAFLSDFNDKN